jgi:hypothetical protein
VFEWKLIFHSIKQSIQQTHQELFCLVFSSVKTLRKQI